MNNIMKLVNNVQIFKDHYLTDKWSINSIAKYYKVAPTTVSKILRSNNVYIKKILNSGKKRIYNINHYYFSNINSATKAYILGFIFADGYITDNNKVGITLKLEDEEILRVIKKELSSEYPLTYHEASYNSNYRKTKKVRFLINSSIMYNNLKSLGCVENKSNILLFPSLTNIPESLISHFIRGYFDGDGSVYNSIRKSRGKYYQNTGFSFIGTKEFITELVKYLPFETNASLYKDKRSSKNVWEFKTSGIKRSLIFYNWLYNDATIYLNRKKERFEQLLNIDVQRL